MFRRTPALLRAAALLAASSLASAQSGAGDWPSYRGPNHDGSTEDDAWASRGLEEPLWEANFGKGYSSPSIARGRLVTLGHFPDEGVDRVTCVDAATGEVAWRFEFEAGDEPMYHGGGTLTTPTILGDAVFCVNRHGRMHALGLADGEILWQRDYAEEFTIPRFGHGVSASPLPTEDGARLVQQFCGTLAVLDAATGDVVWRSEDFGPISQSNPVLLDLPGGQGRGVAAVLGQTFVVFALDDGRVLHRAPWALRGNAMHCAAPVVLDGDRVFLSTAYGKGCAMFRLGESEEPEMEWAHRRMRNKVTATVPYQGHLYGFDESMLRCVDLEGGTTWRTRGLGLGSMTRAGTRLLILDSEGELIVARARPDEYEELSRRKVLDGGVYWTAPVLVGGLIYVRNSLGDLACLDHRLESADATVADAGYEGDVPAPRALFGAHRARVGADALDGKGDTVLRLKGTWEIVLRGLRPAPMELSIAPGSRFLLALEEGGLLYAFDGARSWAVEPQGARTVDGEELDDLAQLFDVEATFAPRAPEVVRTVRRPVRFADQDCWCVTSTRGEEDLVVRHYFAVADGRLVGREGDGMSTLVFDGEVEIGGVRIPAAVTRYRADDGQEHVLRLEAGEWIELSEELFDPPREIRRLFRSEEQIQADEAALRERYGPALGTYRNDEVTILPSFGVEVSDGELRMRDPDGNPFVLDTEDVEDGFMQIKGLPARLKLTAEEGGTRVALLPVPGPQGPRTARYPKVD